MKRQGDLCNKCRGDRGNLETAPEEHKGLLRAARVLLENGISVENEIVPTLVFAALSDTEPLLEHVGTRLVRVQHDSESWAALAGAFSSASDSLEPWKVVEDVPIIRHPPLSLVYRCDKANTVVESITITVHERSVKGEDVAAFYGDALRWRGLSAATARGLIAWETTTAGLALLLRPGLEPELRPMLKFTDINTAYTPEGPRRRQHPFPDPHDVGAIYEALKSRGHAAPGRITSRPPQAYNQITGVVAWYLCDRGRSLDDSQAMRRAQTLIDQFVLQGCKADIPIKTKSTLKRDAVGASTRAQRVYNEICEVAGLLPVHAEVFFAPTD